MQAKCRDTRDTRDTRYTRDECQKKGGTPRAPARAQTGGTHVPEQGESRPQWAPGAMGGAAKRKRADRGAAKAT